jgi:hypothetical protein
MRTCEIPHSFIPANTGAYLSNKPGLANTFLFLLARSRPAFVLSEILRASC